MTAATAKIPGQHIPPGGTQGLRHADTLPILGSLHNTLRAWKNDATLKVADLEASRD